MKVLLFKNGVVRIDQFAPGAEPHMTAGRRSLRVEGTSERYRLLDGLALALDRYGYGSTTVTDIVDLAGVSPSAFYENFESKEDCYEAALKDGLAWLSAAVEAAGLGGEGWVQRLSAGLRAGLDFLAAEPPIANLLLVESLLPSRPARRERERMLELLAKAIRPPLGHPGRAAMSEEATRLLAERVISYLSGRLLAGEVDRLPEYFDALFIYLLTPSLPAPAPAVDEPRS